MPRRNPATNAPGRRLTALLAEADPPSRDVLADILAARFAEVVTATSLAEARDMAQTRQPDLVVAGARFPDGSAAALAADLFAQPAQAQPGPPVVVYPPGYYPPPGYPYPPNPGYPYPPPPVYPGPGVVINPWPFLGLFPGPGYGPGYGPGPRPVGPGPVPLTVPGPGPRPGGGPGPGGLPGMAPRMPGR